MLALTRRSFSTPNACFRHLAPLSIVSRSNNFRPFGSSLAQRDGAVHRQSDIDVGASRETAAIDSIDNLLSIVRESPTDHGIFGLNTPKTYREALQSGL